METSFIHPEENIRYKGKVVNETDMDTYFLETFTGKFKIISHIFMTGPLNQSTLHLFIVRLINI